MILAQVQSEAAWIGGMAGIIAATGVAVVNFYTARAKIKTEAAKAAAELKFTAARTAVEQKAQAERTAVEAWQKIAGYHEERVGRLQDQNDGQQRQIDVLKGQVCDLKEKHEECLENHRDCEEKHQVVVKRLASLEDTVKQTGK